MRKLLTYILIGAAMICARREHAGAPLPSLVFYGMLIDEFGWPYESNVSIEVHSKGQSVFARSIAPARGRDYNFLVRIPYDSGTGTNAYAGAAISPGENISLKIVALETGAILINTNFVVSFPPGAVVNVNLTAGTDSVGDGIPDELRRWIWMNTGGLGAFDPSKILASDDSDLDGVSNLDEYRAGTDPANADDVLELALAPTGVPGVGALSFYTVPGKLYQIQTTNLEPGAAWNIVSFANTPDSAARYSDFLGTGHFASLFIPSAEPSQIYRVVVSSKKGATIVP